MQKKQKQKLQHHFLEPQEPTFLKWDPRLLVLTFLTFFVIGLTCRIQEYNSRFTTSSYKHLLPWSLELTKPSSPTCSMFFLSRCYVLNQECRHQIELLQPTLARPHTSTSYVQVSIAAACWKKVYLHNIPRVAFLCILGLTLPDILSDMGHVWS